MSATHVDLSVAVAERYRAIPVAVSKLLPPVLNNSTVFIILS